MKGNELLRRIRKSAKERALAFEWHPNLGKGSHVEQRKHLAVLLRQSPGLKSILTETMGSTYMDAVDLASKETGLSPETFPARCPFSSKQLLEDDWYPDAP